MRSWQRKGARSTAWGLLFLTGFISPILASPPQATQKSSLKSSALLPPKQQVAWSFEIQGAQTPRFWSTLQSLENFDKGEAQGSRSSVGQRLSEFVNGRFGQDEFGQSLLKTATQFKGKRNVWELSTELGALASLSVQNPVFPEYFAGWTGGGELRLQDAIQLPEISSKLKLELGVGWYLGQESRAQVTDAIDGLRWTRWYSFSARPSWNWQTQFTLPYSLFAGIDLGDQLLFTRGQLLHRWRGELTFGTAWKVPLGAGKVTFAWTAAPQPLEEGWLPHLWEVHQLPTSWGDGWAMQAFGVRFSQDFGTRFNAKLNLGWQGGAIGGEIGSSYRLTASPSESPIQLGLFLRTFSISPEALFGLEPSRSWSAGLNLNF